MSGGRARLFRRNLREPPRPSPLDDQRGESGFDSFAVAGGRETREEPSTRGPIGCEETNLLDLGIQGGFQPGGLPVRRRA